MGVAAVGLFGFFDEKKKRKQQEREEKEAKIRRVLDEGRALEDQGKDKEAFSLYHSIWEQSADAAVAGAEILWKNKAYGRLFRFCTECNEKTHGYEGYAPILKWLAYCYKDGHSTNKDPEKAYKTMKTYLTRGNIQNDIQAWLFLAECANAIYEAIALDCEDFEVDKKNRALDWKAKANKYWEKASQSGDAAAMLQIARNSDADTSFQYYTMAYQAGEYQAAAEMFWRYIHAGKQHAAPKGFQMQKLAKQLQCGANAGNADCMFALALCYAKDFVGTYGFDYHYSDVHSAYQPDAEKFFYWLAKAYQSGCTDPGISVMMAQYYATGKIWHHANYGLTPTYAADSPEINQEKAFAILEPVYLLLNDHIRDNGYDVKTRYWYEVCKPLITMMYLDGRGTEADPKKAFMCVGIGYNENTMCVRDGYGRLLQARIALQEAIGAEENEGYKLVLDEDV